MKLALIAGAAVSLSSVAAGVVEDTVTFNNVASNGVNPPDVRNYVAAANYTLGDISWDGIVNPVDAATWGSELRVDVAYNAGAPVEFTLGSGQVFPAGTNFTGADNAFAGTVVSIGDTWDFSFFDSFDDAAEPDAEWQSITFNFNTFVPPYSFAGNEVGVFTTGPGAQGQKFLGDTRGQASNVNGYSSSPFTYDGGELGYRIDHAGGDLEIFLDIFANNPGGTSENVDGADSSDLDLHLLDSTGFATNGILSTSAAGDPVGTNPNETLFAAALPAGTYYVVVDGFLTSEAAYSIYVVPAPGAVALFGLAGLAGVRRRRA